MSVEAKELVKYARWNFGIENSTVYDTIATAEKFYRYESGAYFQDNSAKYTSLDVGLIYVSDYLYTFANGVDQVCFEKGTCYASAGASPQSSWMFKGQEEWTLNIAKGEAGYVYKISSSGDVNSTNAWDKYGAIVSPNARPVVYLDNQVKIIEGNGSISKPYKLTI